MLGAAVDPAKKEDFVVSFRKEQCVASDLRVGQRVACADGLWRSVMKVTPIKDTNMVRITLVRGHVWDVVATDQIIYQATA